MCKLSSLVSPALVLVAGLLFLGCGHSLGGQIASTTPGANLIVQNRGASKIEICVVRGADTPEEFGSDLGSVAANTVGHFRMDRHKTITFFFHRSGRTTRQETISFSSGVRYTLNEQAELIEVDPLP